MVYLLSGSKEIPETYIAKQLLRQNETVKALCASSEDRNYYSNLSDKIELIDGSLDDILLLEKALDNIDTIIHSNTVIKQMGFEKMRDQYVRKNENLVNLSIEKSLKLCYIGSVVSLGVIKTEIETIDEGFKWENQPQHTDRHRIANLVETEIWRGIQENPGFKALILNSSFCLAPELHLSKISFSNPSKEISLNYIDARDLAAISTELLNSETESTKVILNAGRVSVSQLMEFRGRIMPDIFRYSEKKLMEYFGIENLIKVNYMSTHPFINSYYFKSKEETSSWING